MCIALIADVFPPLRSSGDAAVYFDPSSLQNFADKIASVIDDQAVLDTLALKARERTTLYDRHCAQEEINRHRAWADAAGKIRSYFEEVVDARQLRKCV